MTRARDRVVLLADVARVEDPRGRVERVDGRVDAQLGDRPRQHRGGVEVGERGVRRRVGDVVGGHVDRLHRGDRVTARRGDPLLQHAHLVGQRRLVADRRGHAAEQRRHLGAGLGEPEDVVDEQQHVLLLHVAEVLRHRQRGQRDAQAGARRLVHLAEDQRGLVDDAGLGHLTEEVVALTGALADAGEHRDATEVLGDAVDHLLDEHGLADAGTAEQADLAALHVRREQVDDLDAGLEHLGLGLELVERPAAARWIGQRSVISSDGLGDVQRLAEGVEHVALGDVADRHRDRRAGVGDRGAADQAVGRLHRDGAHQVVAEVLGDLEGQRLGLAAQRDVDLAARCRSPASRRGELDVDDRADDAGDAADAAAASAVGARCSRLQQSSSHSLPAVAWRARPRHRRSR